MKDNSQGRVQWSSQFGFLMAAVGSAIGLGNLWRFPYLVGSSGGALFVLLYVVLLVVIGIPLVLTEISLGSYGQTDAYGTFHKIHPRFGFLGGMGIFVAFMVLSYYVVLGGWVSYYAVAYFKAIFHPEFLPGHGDPAQYFQQFISSPYQSFGWTALFLLLTAGIVFVGVDKGVEKASKLMMPALFVIMIVLAVLGLFQKGSSEGIDFYLNPFRKGLELNFGRMFSDALGQVFYSLSVGMGVMITFGSYLSRNQSLKRNAIIIPLMDTSAAILAGFVLFPAIFSVGLHPNQGPGLLFITLAEVFKSLPFGAFIGFVFFVLVFFAALSSSIALLEVPVTFFIDQYKWPRRKITAALTILCLIMAIPSLLSFGVLREFNLAQLLGNPDWAVRFPVMHKHMFDLVDFLCGNVLLPLGALSMSLVAGWFIGKEKLIAIITHNGKYPFLLAQLYLFIIRWVAPLAIIYVFIHGIFL
jgi:NSS family neurotransmitter:Na+ symporter